MGRRIKKPPVQPEKRKEWLRRVEELGESPPQIAKAEGFDVRTVRKQVELARQEREVREARFMVLRQALERHYQDLVSFAERLNSEVVHASLPMGIERDRLWAALREHLPRSPLWRAIDRMERLNQELRTLEKQAEERLRREVESRLPSGVPISGGGSQVGLHLQGLSGAMAYHLRQVEGGRLLSLETSATGEGLVQVSYGSWTCAVVSPDRMDAAKRFIATLMTEVFQWPEREGMMRVLAERQRVTSAIGEELATIMLRRVVPGRCKYCPI